MENEPKDIFQISKNFAAIVLAILVVLVLIDIVLRFSPQMLAPGSAKPSAVTAVGHHHQFADGSSYYIYTVFENTGDVYQCWFDGTRWNQKRVTNYRGPTVNE